MAEIVFKSNLPTIDALVKTLQDSGSMSILLTGAAQVAATEIKKRWLIGTGADTTVFSKGNPEYLLRKGLSGRNPEINMSYTGDMMKSFKVQKADKDSATLGFTSSELKKARSNYNRRNNMLDVDEPTLQEKARKAFETILKKMVKF